MNKVFMILILVVGAIFMIVGAVEYVVWHFRVEYDETQHRANKRYILMTLLIGLFLFTGGAMIMRSTVPICPSCERYRFSGTTYCEKCGTALLIKDKEEICIECGKECHTPYCGNCGAKQDKE